MNIDEGTLKAYCQSFVQPDIPSVSTSMKDMSDSRKSDIAVSQGIKLFDVPAWVGHHKRDAKESYASDAHNMVAVMGVLKTSGGSHPAGSVEVAQVPQAPVPPAPAAPAAAAAPPAPAPAPAPASAPAPAPARV